MQCYLQCQSSSAAHTASEQDRTTYCPASPYLKDERRHVGKSNQDAARNKSDVACNFWLGEPNTLRLGVGQGRQRTQVASAGRLLVAVTYQQDKHAGEHSLASYIRQLAHPFEKEEARTIKRKHQ